ELKAGNTTRGHKLLSPNRLTVKPAAGDKSFRAYKSFLKKNKVILSGDERKRIILSQTAKKLAPYKAKLYADQELLETLADDVEYPCVFLGEFPKEYLSLPIEVLSVAMREGQKLFSVVKDGQQLPKFVGVADTMKDVKSLIRKGNERVLRARLQDARFFWEQDLKIPLARRSEGLRQIVFQEKLGTYEDKRVRLKELVAYFCDQMEEKEVKKDAVQAAELCKVDLLTEMVREFPSLQGRVGGLYAKAEGYPSGVWRAIYEHYQPLSPEDASPGTLGGAILSIADKLDGIVGVIGIGVQVTGSSDPFGLRRNANGICKTILDRKLDFRFNQLVDRVIRSYGDVLKARLTDLEIVSYVQSFFEQRLRFIYEAQGYRYDLVNAALGAGLENIYRTYLRLKALDSLQKSPDFEPFILMAKRVNNILRDRPPCEVNSDLFAEKEERELYSTFLIVRDNVMAMIIAGDFRRAQSMVFRLQAPLTAFFDRVLVMTEDKKAMQNRLGLLQAISGLLLHLADYSRVVVEGEKKEKPA
ncbi:MAG: glycine--tRNA ligase subunit beta, partial [Acidobacteriota bacterium]